MLVVCFPFEHILFAKKFSNSVRLLDCLLCSKVANISVMKKKHNRPNYSVTMHITPELKAFIGVTSRDTWKYEGHWRGSALELEAAKFGWHNISHILVEDNLTKKQALEYRRELIETAGCVSLSRRMVLEKEHKPQKPICMKEKQISLMASNANGVKLSLTFDNRYESKSGYPVVVRVYKDRKWAYVPTGFSMTASDFKKCGGETLNTLEGKYNKVREWCVKAVSDGSFSLQGAKSCLKAPKVENTLVGLIGMKRQTLSVESTMTNYSNTAKYVAKVFPDGLPIESITADTINAFVRSMKDNGKSDTTMNICLSHIKAAINYAIYKGLFDEKQYPFKKNPWECDKVSLPKSAKRQDRWIGIKEIRTIWERFKTTGNRWLGVFMFSYFTGGMNLADIMDLKFTKEWLTKDVIRFTRRKTAHKTNNTVTVPVSSHIKEIFETMGIVPVEGEYVFNFLKTDDFYKTKNTSATCINRMLKEFGISMTYARHSFATIMNKMGAPFSMTEAAMGHSLSGVSSHYIAPYTPEEMLPWFEKLL